MKRGIGRFFARAIAIAMLLSAAGMIPPSPARTPDQATNQDAVARYEVRLRKLHLVRPDLIPYPIHYDVYC
jgi:hypothetical protein